MRKTAANIRKRTDNTPTSGATFKPKASLIAKTSLLISFIKCAPYKKNPANAILIIIGNKREYLRFDIVEFLKKNDTIAPVTA